MYKSMPRPLRALLARQTIYSRSQRMEEWQQWTATSIGRRNTLIKHMRWCFIFQRFSRSFV